MEPIYDIDGHMICKVDPIMGTLENVYQKQTITVVLPTNGTVQIKRRGNMTQISRIPGGSFRVLSDRIPEYMLENSSE